MSNWPKDKQGRLFKEFKFKNYRQSFAFTCEVAMLAERKNHHPSVTLDYGNVSISIISHDVNEVTERDLDLAAQIDRIYKG
tara:strand:+ start:1225 stop:1467 length:243 start_codon:yes stop_codon:yes gene_type:complete